MKPRTTLVTTATLVLLATAGCTAPDPLRVEHHTTGSGSIDPQDQEKPVRIHKAGPDPDTPADTFFIGSSQTIEAHVLHHSIQRLIDQGTFAPEDLDQDTFADPERHQLRDPSDHLCYHDVQLNDLRDALETITQREPDHFLVRSYLKNRRSAHRSGPMAGIGQTLPTGTRSNRHRVAADGLDRPSALYERRAATVREVPPCPVLRGPNHNLSGGVTSSVPAFPRLCPER